MVQSWHDAADRELARWRDGPSDSYFQGPHLGPVADRAVLIETALRSADRHTIGTILDVGCGTGEDLRALKTILPDARLLGVEPHEGARRAASGAFVLAGTIYDLPTEQRFDLVLTHGVLIHVPPPAVAAAYDALVTVTGRYLLVMEYGSETPDESWPCSGIADRLRGHGVWRRPYGPEIAARSGVRILDTADLADETTFWLLERA